MVRHAPKCPSRGDIGWLSLIPQAGREQAGRRPVICMTPANYNRKAGLAVFCPITSQEKGYPFEVPIRAKGGIRGAVLADQIKSLDWRVRLFDKISKATDEEIVEILLRVQALLSL